MPKRACGEHHPLIVEAGHQHVDAVADRAQHVLLRHLAVGEHQLRGVGAAHAELVELLRRGKALEAFLDDEGGNAAAAGGAVGLGIDHQRVGDRPVGDPHLGAVEHVAVAFLVGAGAHRHHVGAGIGLRHGKRADMLAGDQLGQVFALLRLGAVAADLVDAEIGMGAIGQADRGRGARDLLHRHAMVQIAKGGAAIFFFHGDAVQAERAHLRPQLAREHIVAVDGVGARRDAVMGEIGDALAQHVDVGPEAEIEARPGIGDHDTAHFCLRMISSENRFPLFGIMRVPRRGARTTKLYNPLRSGCQRLGQRCRAARTARALGLGQQPVDRLGRRRLGEQDSPASRRSRRAAAAPAAPRSPRPRPGRSARARGRARRSPG